MTGGEHSQRGMIFFKRIRLAKHKTLSFQVGQLADRRLGGHHEHAGHGGLVVRVADVRHALEVGSGFLGESQGRPWLAKHAVEFARLDCPVQIHDLHEIGELQLDPVLG